MGRLRSNDRSLGREEIRNLQECFRCLEYVWNWGLGCLSSLLCRSGVKNGMIEGGGEGCGAYERKELALYVTEKLKESWNSKGKSARMRE